MLQPRLHITMALTCEIASSIHCRLLFLVAYFPVQNEIHKFKLQNLGHGFYVTVSLTKTEG